MEKVSLNRKLEELASSDMYPFHMPGHKRNMRSSFLSPAYDIDITEIDGFDNLHEPDGVIRDLEERAREYYGVKRAFLLVNGSSSGILSAISTAVPHRGRLLMARNSHKSVYDAVYLGEIHASYFEPEYMEEPGIYGQTNPLKIKELLENGQRPDAVCITSPTYEGFISDVEKIADIVHSHDIPLIVDSAHGAHLAVSKKADISIVSLHKTLPAFTSSALCLLNGDRIDAKRLKKHINIFQTSSPSYLIMSGIEQCFDILEKDGVRLKERLEKNLDGLYETCRENEFIKAIDPKDFPTDATKINIYDRSGRLSGREIYDRLREDFHIQPEMASGRLCLLMSSIMDTDEGFGRLKKALRQIDDDIRSGKYEVGRNGA